jgi:hypothetical protein
MVEWMEDHVAAIGPLKLNSILVVRILAKLEGGTLRWKGEDRRLGRSVSGVWKAGIFKAVAPAVSIKNRWVDPMNKY